MCVLCIIEYVGVCASVCVCEREREMDSEVSTYLCYALILIVFA